MDASHNKPDETDTIRRHTRPRRAVKIVGPWRVGASLVFGVVATLFVAWWFQTWYWTYDFPEWKNDREYWGACYSADGAYFMQWVGNGFTPGLDSEGLVLWSVADRRSRGLEPVPVEEQSTPSPRLRAVGLELQMLLDAKKDHSGQGTIIRSGIEVTGLPFRCFYHWRVRVYDENGNPSVAIDRGKWTPGNTFAWYTRQDEISVLPIWSGLAGNTFFYGVLIYAAVSIPHSLVGLRRRLTNRCHPCGYRLDGLTTDACPECGWAIRRKGARSGRDGDT